MAPDPLQVAERVDARLTRGLWNTSALEAVDREVEAAAEVAAFALRLGGKSRQARQGGRLGRLIVRFALAACVALASAATACAKPDASPEATQTAINQSPAISGSSAAITASPRASPARFQELTLVDAGSASQPWAVALSGDNTAPILVDRTGSGLDTLGATYVLAAQPVPVGTRDGPSQFLDPLQPAVQTSGTPVQPANSSTRQQLEQRWSQDERYLAPTRAIAGNPTVLDAAYNAAAAATAGGTHTYLNGVVLRVEPDKPVIEVIDRALLESGLPTRAEDVVYVAIRGSEQSLYNPGQVVNLRDVVMDKQDTDVNGQSTTVYVANAALDGARVEPSGSVNLQALLQPRLQRVDQDVQAAQTEAGATPVPARTATPGATSAPASSGQPIIIQQHSGPSFIDDFLIWMWLSNSGFYRGPSVIINNPPPAPYRSGEVYYSAPPPPSGSSPSSVASQQAASRSTAIQAARSTVSGQASGSGGGVAATNKSAAAASAQVSAATAKSASIASTVSSSSAGKSVASVPSSSSSTASRSAGSVSAGTRGSAGTSASSGSSGGKTSGGSSSGSSGGKSSGGSSSSGGGFGGKGISGTGGSA